MTRWQLEYDPAAKKELAKLDKTKALQVAEYLNEVCKLEDPASRGHSMTGPLAGLHRYQLGQLRILVKIKRNIVTVFVLSIGRRDTIYK